MWTPTFLRTNPEKNEIYLPGIGNQQKCSYTPEVCTYVKYDNVTQAVFLPIECLVPGGESEKRYLRIHYIHRQFKTDYIFSLDVPGTSDKILFHNYNNQKLTDLILSRVIRF